LRRSCTVWPVQPDSRRLFARRAHRRSSRRRPLRLGPRSLDPDRSFWSACAELIRDQTPPTDFCNQRFFTTCGQPNRGPRSSQGRRPQSPSFSQRAELPPLRERRRAASRAPSVRSNLGVGSSRLPEFARPRCRLERATSDGFRRRSVVTIDVHGSVDRVKDVIRPNARGSSPSISGACALFGACRRRSPPREPQDTLCPRRVRRHGRNPLPTVDHRPRPVFRRCPAKSTAFPRTGASFTVTCFTAEARRRLLVSACPRRPPAHAAPTFSPGWGEC